MKNSLENWLILHFSWISALKFKTLMHQFSDVSQLVMADEKYLAALGLSKEIIEKIKNPNQKEIEKALEFSLKNERHILTFDHPDYPPLLKEITDPPLLLYLWGNPKVLQEPSIGIVGSRNPTHSGAENAYYFAYELSKRGFCITSGMAIGIDGQSHRGALEADGKTIAVLGSGLQHIYPYKHRELAELIAINGAIISEFSLETPPNAIHFPKRNRIISGISMGTLIVEATLRSGSLITARLAMEQNREVFAIPGSIHAPQSKGCHAILKDGATLAEDVDDIVKEVGQFTTPEGALICPKKTQKEPKDPKSQLVLNAIGFDQVSVDQLVSRLGLSPGSVSALLVSLELQGYIKPTAGGYIRVDI